jgi:enoyl-CoA hydratase
MLDLNIENICGATVIRFTRPEIRNPLSIAVLHRLHAEVDGIALDANIHTLIFTGTDDSFAAGADLNEIAEVTRVTAKDFARYGQSLMTKVAAMPQKTIAAINGFCFGGALDLALSCDLRIASPNAKFAHPGAGLGIITGWGGTQRLPRLIGQAMALELFFLAAPVDAATALRIGLVDEISNDALTAALSQVNS